LPFFLPFFFGAASMTSGAGVSFGAGAACFGAGAACLVAILLVLGARLWLP
jgi:hypothetical protein